MASKWFEPRSISSSCSVIVRVSVVLKRTVGDSDWRFDNLSGRHLQIHCDNVITLSQWLWRWRPLRLSKRQSLSPTVLFRTTLTRTITLHELQWQVVASKNITQRNCFPDYSSYSTLREVMYILTRGHVSGLTPAIFKKTKTAYTSILLANCKLQLYLHVTHALDNGDSRTEVWPWSVWPHR